MREIIQNEIDSVNGANNGQVIVESMFIGLVGGIVLEIFLGCPTKGIGIPLGGAVLGTLMGIASGNNY